MPVSVLAAGGVFIGEHCAGEVFERRPDGLEERDRRCAATAFRLTAYEFGQLSPYVALADDARIERLHEIAAFAECPGARIDEDFGPADRFVVGFPHRRLEGPDEIEVSAGFEPRTPDEGFIG